MTQFLEKYASHFIWKVCVWEGVGDRTELQHIDPHSYGHQRYFPVLLGCSTGGLGPSLSGCWFSQPHLISNWSGVQTDWISSALCYIIVQRPLSCERHNRTHSTRPRSWLYSDIPWADSPVIYIGAFPILTARPGRRSIYNTMNDREEWRERVSNIRASSTTRW